MPNRAVSWMDQTTLQGILAAETSVLFLYTLTVTHSTIDTIRVVNDTQDLQRSSGMFARFPFDVTTPASTSEKPPMLNITIDIVDQRIIAAFRSLKGSREKPKLTIERVTKHTPDQVMYRGTFDMTTFKTDSASKGSVQASLIPGSLNDSYPKYRDVPSLAGR